MLSPLVAHGDILLPSLGNSSETDRLMLREIGDQQVFAPLQINSGKPLPLPSSDVWTSVIQSTRLLIPEREEITIYRDQYQREAPWISGILDRASPFIGYVVDELDKRFLPVELALLPIIESGYRADVRSPQQALGIWQIVPTTAADIGISHTSWFDGRSDIRESTRAAIDYLGYLNAEFHGDWPLTLAAYNAGPGRVRTAIKLNENADLPTDFWSLTLPAETRHYVPKFLALLAMLRYDRPSGLTLPTVSLGSAFDLVDTGRRVSLDRLAIITGISEDYLRQLNAGLVYGITPPAGPHLVYLPQGFGASLVDLLKWDEELTLYTWVDSYEVQSGDTLGSIARRHEVSLQKLRLMNDIDGDFIRPGQTLKVRNPGNIQPRMQYVVTIGDTLTEIAERFMINVNAIRDEQGRQLPSDVIHPGETLSLLIDAQHTGY